MTEQFPLAVLTEAVDGRYGKIRFFANDPVVGQALRLYGEWAQVELEFFEKLIPDGGTVLDIGGYVGTHALAFSHFVGPHGKVYTFEPQPASFRLLTENLAANGAAQVVASQAAVGKAPAVIELPSLNIGQIGSFGSFSVHEGEGAGTLTDMFSVNLVTVDQLDLARCDFMKVDVEGMESEVIDGAVSVITRLQPIVYAECNSVDAGASTLRSLKALGYKTYLHVVDAFNADNFKGAATNIFGPCKEVGILGLPPNRAHLARRFSSPKWTTFDVETLDDLVYGMLQKPQYGDEVLRAGAAAKAGGMVVQEPELRHALAEVEALRAEGTAAYKEIELLRHSLAESEARHTHAEAARKEIELRHDLAETELRHALAEVEVKRDEAEAARAEIERQRTRAETELRHAEAAGAAQVEQVRAEVKVANARADQHHAALVEEQNARERDRVAYMHERDLLRATAQMLQPQANELARIRLSLVYKMVCRLISVELRLRGKLRPRERLGRLKSALIRPERPRLVIEPAVAQGSAVLIEASPAPIAAELPPLRTHPITLGSGLPVHSERPLLLCLSHVAPWPPRAGNEYRIHRLLTWAKHAGYDLAVVLCPLPGEEMTQAAEAVLAGVYDNLLVVDRGGHIRHSVARDDLAQAVDALNNRKAGNYPGRNGHLGEKINEILTVFAPDALLELLHEIDQRNIVRIYWINYVFMSRAFDVIESQALTLIDTHDVFSTKAAKVTRFGIRDDLCISAGEEGQLLNRADVVVAIQSDEVRELLEIVPGKRIVTVGVDMERAGAVAPPVTAPILLMVASNNAMNQKGLFDFLRFAWPRIRQAVPEAELHVVGAVGQNLTGAEPGVVKLGFVDNLEEAYDRARLVINPAVAGTGLKIKTLEALMQLKPVVLWPSGLDGISPDLRKHCRCVNNWYDFGVSVIELLQDETAIRRIYEDREVISRLLSPDHVYHDLELVFDEHKV